MAVYLYGHSPGFMLPGSSVQVSPAKPFNISPMSETLRMYYGSNLKRSGEFDGVRGGPDLIGRDRSDLAVAHMNQIFGPAAKHRTLTTLPTQSHGSPLGLPSSYWQLGS